MDKIIIFILLLFVASCSTPPEIDQGVPGDLNRIKIKVKQMNAEEANNSQVKYCTAHIEVFENERRLKKIDFKDMIPMKQGPYGVMILERRFPKHHVIVKQGDYDGRTFFIDGYGKITNMKAGNRYVMYRDKIYIYYDSDLLGYAIFNLTTGKEEYPTVDVDRPFQFVLCQGNSELLIKVGRLIYEVDSGKTAQLQRGQRCNVLPVKKFIPEWINCRKYN